MCSLRVWQPTFWFPLLQYYPLSSQYCGVSQWHHHGHQPAAPGALEWLQQTSPAASAPVSQCSTLRKEPPSVTLGVSSSTGEREDPLWPEGMDSAIPPPIAILMQMPSWVATPGGTPSFTHITHPLLQTTVLKTLEVASMHIFPPGLSKLNWWISYFLCRGEWIQP